jgi:hypothetical protein
VSSGAPGVAESKRTSIIPGIEALACPQMQTIIRWSAPIECLLRQLGLRPASFRRPVAASVPLDLHLVMDNYAAHKHPAVKAWLAASPRVHVHFTPTHASWMNLVDVWFFPDRTPGHPRRHVRLRPRSQRQDPRLHRRLERPCPPLRVDQDR